MDISKIEKLLRRCELNDLYEIETILSDLIQKEEVGSKRWNDDDGRKQRKEKRFETNLLGTLTRITDVKPGERKEYSVTIGDISRSGMRLQVDGKFNPSRVVEVMFASPGGKIKRCFVEVVRMQKMSNQDGNWLELGCRTVRNEEVRRLRLQEEVMAKMRSKLNSRSGILILVVGLDTESTEKQLTARVKSQKYIVRQVDNVHQAVHSAEKIKAQLAIFCQGSPLCRDEESLAELKKKPKGLAVMAIIEKEEDRMPLMMAGVDECLTVKNSEDYLFNAIERALIGHAMRNNNASQQLSGRVLIFSIDNSRINLMAYQLEENGYNFRVMTDIKESQHYAKDPFDLILADYDDDSAKEFRELAEMFSGLPLIALCENVSQGQQAIMDGASNYLCMPPRKEDVQMILELARKNLQPASF